MKKLHFRKIALFILVAFALIQLIPVDRSNPAIESEIIAPPEIQNILRKSCYDCHSNETVWPWYSKVAPVSWLLTSDIDEGRNEVNFSTWGNYNAKRQTKMLKESLEEVSENEMPPWSYLLMHKNAVLSAEERELFRKWIIEVTTK